MRNSGRLSTYWRTEIYFLLAGAIFVACQFVVANGRQGPADGAAESGRVAQAGGSRTPAIEDNR
jgi:hypothetical protein